MRLIRGILIFMLRFNKNFLMIFMLLILIGIAAFFRFSYIDAGIPNKIRLYSYHPDEFLTVETAFQRVIKEGSVDMKFYNYPSLFMFASAFSIMIGNTYGGEDFDISSLYYYAKITSAVMGVLAVIAVFFAGSYFWNRRAGFISALIIALAPLHLMNSHFATVDVPSTLFIGITLIFCAFILKEPKWKYILWAGAFSGMAMGTKYNAVLVFLSMIASIFLSDFKSDFKTKVIKILSSFGILLLAFIVTTPGAIINIPAFVHGIKYEMVHQSVGHESVFSGIGNTFLFNLKTNLFYGFGILTTILSLIGIVYGCLKKDKKVFTLLAFVVPYYIFISMSNVNFARYLLPIYPILALLAGYALNFFTCNKENIANRAFNVVIVCLFMGIFAQSAYITLQDFKHLPQEEMTLYLEKNIYQNVKEIGIIGIPWFYSPNYSEYSGYAVLPIRQKEMKHAKINLKIINSSMKLSEMPKYVVVSDYEFVDDLRARARGDKYNKNIADVMNLLKKDYKILYSTERKAFNQENGSPHDMSYFSPRIYLYEKKKN